MEKIALDPESGIELREYLVALDGYLAGVKAGVAKRRARSASIRL